MPCTVKIKNGPNDPHMPEVRINNAPEVNPHRPPRKMFIGDDTSGEAAEDESEPNTDDTTEENDTGESHAEGVPEEVTGD